MSYFGICKQSSQHFMWSTIAPCSVIAYVLDRVGNLLTFPPPSLPLSLTLPVSRGGPGVQCSHPSASFSPLKQQPRPEPLAHTLQPQPVTGTQNIMI